MKKKLKKIVVLVLCVVILNGCGAKLLAHRPVENPDILDAMQTIRKVILQQPEHKVPSQVEITENTLKIIGNFEGKKGENNNEEGFIYFKDITSVKYHKKRNWFIVSLINKQSDHLLFRYFSLSEADAQQFIDNIQTLIKHKADPQKPIVLANTALRPAEIKKLSMSLELHLDHPNTKRFLIAESKYLNALDNIVHLTGENNIDVAEFSNNLASVYQSIGQYEQAEPLYIRSLAIYENIFGKDHVKVIGVLDGLTKLYAEQGRFQKAEAVGKKSLAIKQQKLGKEDVSVIASLDNLSSINQAQGHYERADMFNERSLSIKERVILSGHINAALALSNIFTRTKLTPSGNDLGIAKGFNQVTGIIGLAITGIYLTDYMLSGFDIGMYANKKRTKKIVNNTALANIYHAQSKYTQAEPLFKEVLEINKQELGDDHLNVANSLRDLAKTYYAQGKYKKSEPLLHQALTIHENKLGSNHPSVADNLNILALVHSAQNQNEKAKPLFRKSLRSINRSLNRWLWGAGEKTRLAYLQQQETRRDIYLSFYSLTNDPDEALYFSLTRKGLLLRISSEVSNLAKQSTDPSIKKKTQTFNALRTQLSELYLTEKTDQAEIQALEEKINTIEQQLSQQISSFKDNQNEVTAAQVLDKLNPTESLVDFLIYKDFDFKNRKFKEEQVIALVANKQNGVQLVNLGSLAPIAATIKTYRSNISRIRPAKSSAQTLFQQLWAPLTPYLKNTKTVYVVPDGPLHLLPFKAIQDQEGLYLTEKWQLITLNSPRDIVLTKKSDKTTTAAAIFAAPDFEDKNEKSTVTADIKAIHFSELPGTLKEGQQIEKLFTQKQSQSSVKLFTKRQATEQKIMSLTSPKILHLATHGFFLKDNVKDNKTLERGLTLRSGQEAIAPLFIQNPLARSGLAFAGANSGIKGYKRADETNGILTALEVLNLNLEGTDLVVLSACETGLGDIKVGEGVYSLNRSFQEAGAKMVLSTLWSVADDATGIFMQKFYSRFLDGESAQKAMQKTQNEFMRDEKYSNPFYWAGFVMIGKE